MKKKTNSNLLCFILCDEVKKLREIDDDLRLRKKVAEMSRQRQTEELVSKEKLP